MKSNKDLTGKEKVEKWPFKVLPDGEGKPHLHVTYKNKEESFYPEQIIAMVLSRLKVLAGELFRSPVKKVVITVPAAFSDAQRQATIDATRIAGLDVLRVINEPISTLGDVYIGGGDFDVRLKAHFEKQFAEGDLEGNLRAKWRLRAACEKAKKELSTEQRAFIELDNFIEGHDLHGKIARAKFEELCSDLFTKQLPLRRSTLSRPT